jgi:hypothetical protein
MLHGSWLDYNIVSHAHSIKWPAQVFDFAIVVASFGDILIATLYIFETAALKNPN